MRTDREPFTSQGSLEVLTAPWTTGNPLRGVPTIALAIVLARCAKKSRDLLLVALHVEGSLEVLEGEAPAAARVEVLHNALHLLHFHFKPQPPHPAVQLRARQRRVARQVEARVRVKDEQPVCLEKVSNY
jgi:hypothetical protein